MNIVRLDGLTQPALIIPCASGVTYRQQCGGTMCLQRELEGMLVPFNDDFLLEHHRDSLEYRLMKLFSGGFGEIDRSMAGRMQEVLDTSPFTRDIRIDLDRVSEAAELWVSEAQVSVESWVYVRVSGGLADTLAGFGEVDAVLTWPNSD